MLPSPRSLRFPRRTCAALSLLALLIPGIASAGPSLTRDEAIAEVIASVIDTSAVKEILDAYALQSPISAVPSSPRTISTRLAPRRANRGSSGSI